MKSRIVSILIIAFLATTQLYAQESPRPTRDYKNDISLSFTNVLVNDVYNGIGPAVVYRKWVKPNVAIKAGVGSAFNNDFDNDIVYKLGSRTVSRNRHRDNEFYYLMLGFEAKKQVFQNFAIYYGANFQIGGTVLYSQEYTLEEDYINNKYTHERYNFSNRESSGFQTSFCPVVGVKYQLLKRMELGTEFRTFNLSTIINKGYSSLDVNAQFNANMYLTYRFGKRKN